MSSNPPQQTFNPSDPASALDMLASIADSFQANGTTHRAISQAVQTLKNRIEDSSTLQDNGLKLSMELGELKSHLVMGHCLKSCDGEHPYEKEDEHPLTKECRLWEASDPEAPDPPKQGAPENPEVGFVHEPAKA